MVTHIPDTLSFPFTVWMYENGFYAGRKKGFLVLKRGESVAKISMLETDMGSEMNEFCQRKFLQFCKAWLNRDKTYVEQLRMRGALKMNQLSYQMVA